MIDEDKVKREVGCKCQWEIGDSPCPVHGDDEDLPNTNVRDPMPD